MIDWTKVLLLIAGFHWSGLCMLRLIPPRAGGGERGHQPRLPFEWWFPASFALGVGVHAVAQLLALLLTGSVLSALIWLVPALATLFLLRGGPAGARAFAKSLAGSGLLAASAGGPSARALRFLALILVALNLGLVLNEAVSWPMIGYDERAIWSLKAKILHAEGGTDGTAFTDPFRVHYHPDYPLLVPLTEYALYESLGSPDERRVRFLFFWFLLCATFGLAGAILERAGPLAGLLGALIFVALSSVYGREEEGLISSAADIPISFFAFMSVTAFARSCWRPGSRSASSELLLSGAFLACALMTKNEGALLFVACALVAIPLGLRGATALSLKDRVLATSGWLAAALIPALPCFAVVARLPNFYDEDFGSMLRAENLAGAVSRIPLVLSSFVSEAAATQRWNLVWLLWPLSILVPGPRSGVARDRAVDLILALWICAYLAVYCFTPLHVDFHTKTSLFRLLAHPLPLVIWRICIAGARLAAPQSRESMAPDPQPESAGRIVGSK